MSIELTHKKSKKKTTIQGVVSYTDREIPYDVIPHAKFEVTYNKDHLDAASKEKVQNAPSHHRFVIFLELNTPIPNGALGVNPETSWKDIKEWLVLQIRKYGGYNNPEDIVDIAFSTTPYFTPGVTKIVDTCTIKPYDAFPDFASVHIVMLKRASVGWIPLMIAYQMCATCGKTESLKACSACNSTRYCSKECQKKDWKEHKITCSRK